MIFVRGDRETGGEVHFEGAAARILKDGAVVLDWTEGGLLSGVPLGKGYTLEVQGAEGVVSSDLVVGLTVFTLGQSNMTGWFWDPTKHVAAGGAYVWNGTDWTGVNSAGAVAFADTLSAALGDVPIAFVDGSQPGSALLKEVVTNSGRWLAEESDGIYANALKELAASGLSSPDLVLWIQGETDATRLVSPTAYSEGLQTLFLKLRADLGEVPIVMGGLGPGIASAEVLQSYAAIRLAQAEAAAALPNVTYVATSPQLPLLDFVHLAGASRAWQGIDLAKAAAAALGGATGGFVEIVLSPDGESYMGSDAPERILGGAAADHIDAGGGNDIAWVGLGDDVFDGGDGDDTVAGDGGADHLLGGLGRDDLYGDDGDDVLEGGEGDDVLVGGLGDDKLYGGAGDDYLEGGRGSNLLVGGAGNDTYNIKNTTDTSVRPGGWLEQQIVEEAGGGIDTVLTPYNWVLGSQIENLVLGWPATDGTGNELANTIIGNGIANKLTGLGGNDVLDGREGADRLIGGAGNDLYIVDNAGDVVVEAERQGEDTVRSTVSYTLGAEIETLLLTGEAAIDGTGNTLANRIQGNGAANVLMGLGGNDVLFGGAGDLLDGGEGLDMAVLAGRRAAYEITRTEDQTIVTGADGSVRLVGIERIAFADGTYDIASETFVSTETPAAPLLSYVAESAGEAEHVVASAAPGSLVTLRDGDRVLASGLAGADGLVTLWAGDLGPGTHRLTATAGSAEGSAGGAASNTVSVEVATIADIVARLAALKADPTLAGLHVVGSHVVAVSSVAEMQDLRQAGASVLAKIAGGHSFEIARVVAGVTYVTDYDSEGRVTERTTIQPDGDKTINTYDIAGRWIGQVHAHDGLYEVHQYAVTGQPYARQDAIYTEAGKLVSMTRTYADGNRPAFEQTVHADGSQTVKNWGVDGSLQIAEMSATNGLRQLDRYAADGKHIYSESRAPDGAKAVHTLDPVTGEELSYQLLNADKSQVSALYHIVGKSYGEQIAYFDAAGKQVELTRYYADAKHTLAFEQLNHADGSSDVRNYDTSGRKTIDTHSEANGLRDTIQFTYAGLSADPATATHTHWGVGGVRQWIDETRADRSHVQTAFVAGLDLVSHAGVADLFNGIRGGSDAFVIGADSGRDTIANFEVGGAAHDVVKIAGHQVASFADLRAMMTRSGNDTLVTFDADDSLLLKNVALASLTAAHFVFVAEADPMAV